MLTTTFKCLYLELMDVVKEIDVREKIKISSLVCYLNTIVLLIDSKSSDLDYIRNNLLEHNEEPLNVSRETF